jgi:hypothetical protein
LGQRSQRTCANAGPSATRLFGEAHLRRILAAYTGYYNELRTHLSLSKDSPAHRPIHRYGQIAAWPILGGLHH